MEKTVMQLHYCFSLNGKSVCYTSVMQGPDNNISGFTKNLYLYISIVFAIVAGVIVYSAAQGNTETSLNVLSKTSQRFAKALAACKTGTFDIHGKSYTVTPRGTPAPTAPDGTTLPVLNYTNHAVRGNVNSDAFYDMVCTYDLIDPTAGTQSYIGVLFGAENSAFFPGPMLLIGPQVKIDALSITSGIGTIDYSSTSTIDATQTEKRFFLDGDTLTFADSSKGGF
jgi:hypothetical protein